jgi:LPXTG-site transpeptidase (sortase) family protein
LKKENKKVAQDNNLVGDNIRSRMKKYDSYNHNSRSSYRSAGDLIKHRTKPELSSRQQEIARPVFEPPKQKFNPQPSTNTQSLSQTTNVVQNNNQSTPQSVAMKAVKSSKPDEHNNFSDDFFTVYGEKKRRLSFLQKSLYGLGVLVIVFSGFVSIQTYLTNKYAKEQVQTLGASTDEQGVSEGTGSEPSEESISESTIRAYTVSNPEDPRYFIIPELRVFARVKNLGVTPEGAVDSPKNIHDTGWYNGSVRPGSKSGSSLILGHLSGWTGPGVFKNISKMKVGSRFEIEKGSGEKIYYEVTKTEQLPQDQVDMSKILSTEKAGEHDIKLMTCSGKYNRETKEYEERFTVYAKQLK